MRLDLVLFVCLFVCLWSLRQLCGEQTDAVWYQWATAGCYNSRWGSSYSQQHVSTSYTATGRDLRLWPTRSHAPRLHVKYFGRGWHRDASLSVLYCQLKGRVHPKMSHPHEDGRVKFSIAQKHFWSFTVKERWRRWFNRNVFFGSLDDLHGATLCYFLKQVLIFFSFSLRTLQLCFFSVKLQKCFADQETSDWLNFLLFRVN